MANYNIEMNSLNSDGNYDVLYPRTLLNNVTDWSNNVYSKSEVDSQVSNLNSTISNLNSTISSVSSNLNNMTNKLTNGTLLYQGTLPLNQSVYLAGVSNLQNVKILVFFADLSAVDEFKGTRDVYIAIGEADCHIILGASTGSGRADINPAGFIILDWVNHNFVIIPYIYDGIDYVGIKLSTTYSSITAYSEYAGIKLRVYALL